MAQLVAVLTGATFGLGVLLLVAAAQKRPVLPRRQTPTNRPSVQRSLVTVTICSLAAISAYAATGWISLAAVVFGFGLAMPTMLKNRGQRQRELERAEAIASWTELIRDNISGAAGLEQALIVASEIGPPAIRPELQLFLVRLPRRKLQECLILLSRDLDSRASDLVVAALVQASSLESRALSPLLSRLAASIRENVRMQQRVEVGRTRIRTSARIVVIVTVLTIVVLTLIAPQIVEVYSTPAGQLWLLVVFTIFVGAGAMMRRLGNAELGNRFELNPNLLKRGSS